MFTLSASDLAKLAQVDPALEALAIEAAKITEQPFTIFEGLRTLARQKQYLAQGVSKTMKSRHLVGMAIDAVPLVRDKKGNLVPSWDLGACKLVIRAFQYAENRLRESKVLDQSQPILYGGVSWGWDWAHIQLNSKYQNHVRAVTPAQKAAVTRPTPPAQVKKLIQTTALKSIAAPVASFSATIQEAQENLNYINLDLKLFPGALRTDGKMGPKTVQAVQIFQRHAKLSADGVIGPRTAEALAWAIKREGERRKALAAPVASFSATIQEAQENLDLDLDLFPGAKLSTDGVIGPRTAEALAWAIKREGERRKALAGTQAESVFDVILTQTKDQAIAELVTPPPFYEAGLFDGASAVPTNKFALTEQTTKGSFMSGKKTYAVALLAVLGAVGSYLSGSISLLDLFNVIQTSAIGATLRSAITSSISNKLGL
jgi:peptidoglycan L-alanyl-D-glutamate endopeptidase CwlK